MNLMPVGLNMAGKSVLVVGGGSVGLRKIRMLLLCKAKVTLISPVARPELLRLSAKGKIIWKRRAFRSNERIAGTPALIFACTDSAAVNLRLARLGRTAGIWVNRADSPAESDIHIPAVARLGALTLGIFSGGRAPAFVKYVRKRIELELGPHVSAELRLLSDLRRRLQKSVPNFSDRKRILARLLENGTLETLREKPARAREKIVRRLILVSISDAPSAGVSDTCRSET